MEESSPIVAAIVVIILPAVIFGAVLKSYKGAFVVGFLLLLLLFLQTPTGLYVFCLLILLPFFAYLIRANKKIAAMPLAERQRYLDERRVSALTLGHGSINLALICPHCQEKGKVSVKSVQRNKGIHGTKAAGAALTAGISLFFVGLSRKEQMTQAYCSNCQSTWEF